VDGLEYRWYKWVVDYNMERQLSVFRGIGRVFSRGEEAGIGRGDRRAPVRVAAPWLLAPLGLALLWLIASRRRRPGGRLHRASRTYLSLRKAYARAGWGPADGGPLEFAQKLESEEAPGADDAARAVDLYLRARFSADVAGPPAARELDEHATRAKTAVRRAGKRRKPAGV
jgi:hypothetical protein